MDGLTEKGKEGWMNECLHGGGTARTPPGQEFDGGGFEWRKGKKNKRPSHLNLGTEGLHVALGRVELKCAAPPGVDGQVKQTTQQSECGQRPGTHFTGEEVKFKQRAAEKVKYVYIRKWR